MWIKRAMTMQVFLSVLGLLSLMTTLTSAQDLTYQNLVNGFINDYNRKSESENLFRLLILNLQLGENNDPATTSQPLTFSIGETVCHKTENINPDECDFKENGVVKECTGAIALDSTQPFVNVSCEGVERVKRRRFGKLRKILKKVGKTLKKALNNIRIGYSVPIGR